MISSPRPSPPSPRRFFPLDPHLSASPLQIRTPRGKKILLGEGCGALDPALSETRPTGGANGSGSRTMPGALNVRLGVALIRRPLPCGRQRAAECMRTGETPRHAARRHVQGREPFRTEHQEPTTRKNVQQRPAVALRLATRPHPLHLQALPRPPGAHSPPQANKLMSDPDQEKWPPARPHQPSRSQPHPSDLVEHQLPDIPRPTPRSGPAEEPLVSSGVKFFQTT